MFLSFVGVAAQRTFDARGSRDVVVVVFPAAHAFDRPPKLKTDVIPAEAGIHLLLQR